MFYLKETIDEDCARVDHGEFVHELHLILQRHVEHPRPEADHQQEDVRNEEPEKNYHDNHRFTLFGY